jgi:hypothetical protein
MRSVVFSLTTVTQKHFLRDVWDRKVETVFSISCLVSNTSHQRLLKLL